MRIKVAVAGFGFMGVTHTINILKNPDLELVAIVDKFPDNIRKNLNEQLGNFSTGTIDEEVISKLNIYSALDDCLAAEALDACIIAVHTDLHYELAVLALNAGVPVFLEKPFSLSVTEGRKLIELARKKNLVLMIGHVVRFMPAYQTLKHWIDSGEYGALKFLSLSRFSGLPAWGQWKEKRKAFGSSGGALFDLLIHDIDFAQWVMGVPDTIHSICLPGELSAHDYVNATWNYGSGTTVKIEGGNIFHTTFPFRAGFIALFENASVSYSSSSPDSIKVSTDADILHVPAGNANEGFSGEINYFANCLKENVMPDMCTPESALRTIEVCYRHLSDPLIN
jgi:predicted dehydrogenase